jgi:hypothetical protein
VTGIPIHHYVEADFQAFAGLVDALGGVDVRSAEPSTVGCADGWDALARARLRRPTPVSAERRSDSGDLLRGETQEDLAIALVERFPVGAPLHALRVARSAVAGHAVIDPGWSARRVVDIFRRPGTPTVRTYRLPVLTERPTADLRSPFPPHLVSGATYLVADQPAASELLHALRGRMRERDR